jgi:Fe-S oxidoreductase
MDSPRGRIYQMLQVDEGRLALGDSFVTHIDRCLGCLNCQTACPSGVQYGHLLETTRAQIEQSYQRPRLQRKLREHFYALVRQAVALGEVAALLSALGTAKPGPRYRTAEGDGGCRAG